MRRKFPASFDLPSEVVVTLVAFVVVAVLCAAVLVLSVAAYE